jgi:hypothetical protein
MIECEAQLPACFGWYHADCVGLGHLNEHTFPAEWVCDTCRAAKAEAEPPSSIFPPAPSPVGSTNVSLLSSHPLSGNDAADRFLENHTSAPLSLAHHSLGLGVHSLEKLGYDHLSATHSVNVADGLAALNAGPPPVPLLEASSLGLSLHSLDTGSAGTSLNNSAANTPRDGGGNLFSLGLTMMSAASTPRDGIGAAAGSAAAATTPRESRLSLAGALSDEERDANGARLNGGCGLNKNKGRITTKKALVGVRMRLIIPIPTLSRMNNYYRVITLITLSRMI